MIEDPRFSRFATEFTSQWLNLEKFQVVEVDRQKAHPMYLRVIKRSSKFYAHDENNTAHVGDVVKIVETRPLSKQKRWRLAEIVRKSALAPQQQAKPEVGG